MTGPTYGLIGENGYNEAVIPLKDSNDPLGQKAVLKELMAMRDELTEIKRTNKETADNTKRQRVAT